MCITMAKRLLARFRRHRSLPIGSSERLPKRTDGDKAERLLVDFTSFSPLKGTAIHFFPSKSGRELHSFDAQSSVFYFDTHLELFECLWRAIYISILNAFGITNEMSSIRRSNRDVVLPRNYPAVDFSVKRLFYPNSGGNRYTSPCGTNQLACQYNIPHVKNAAVISNNKGGA